MLITLMIIAVILAIGMIAEEDKNNKKLYCWSFMVCIAGAVILKVVEVMA